jgi:hypothetical protein
LGEALHEVSDTSDHVDDEYYNIEYKDLDGIGLRMRDNNGSDDESPIGSQVWRGIRGAKNLCVGR